jgi:hypothetical protein
MKIKFGYELCKNGDATYYLYFNLKRETYIITAYHRGLYHKRVFRKNPKKIFMFPSLFIWSYEDREINAIESKLLNLSKEEMIKIVDNVCNFSTTELRSTLLKHIRNESIF